MNYPDDAECRNYPLEWWFPERDWTDEAKQAIAICNRCPVQDVCAKLGQDERWGIWGGIYRSATGMRRRHRREAAQAALGRMAATDPAELRAIVADLRRPAQTVAVDALWPRVEGGN